MKNDASELLKRRLSLVFSEEDIDSIIRMDNYITRGQMISVFHPDIVHSELYQVLLSHNLPETEARKKTLSLVSDLIQEFRKLDYYIIDKWMVSIESKSCTGCPAYLWVVHRPGVHTCRLNMDIEEIQNENHEWSGRPVKECLRPQNVGASFYIARELKLPEPMVGKLNKSQYDLFCEEEMRYAD